jgi:hypothetical protein
MRCGYGLMSKSKSKTKVYADENQRAIKEKALI